MSVNVHTYFLKYTIT